MVSQNEVRQSGSMRSDEKPTFVSKDQSAENHQPLKALLQFHNERHVVDEHTLETHTKMASLTLDTPAHTKEQSPAPDNLKELLETHLKTLNDAATNNEFAFNVDDGKIVLNGLGQDTDGEVRIVITLPKHSDITLPEQDTEHYQYDSESNTLVIEGTYSHVQRLLASFDMTVENSSLPYLKIQLVSLYSNGDSQTHLTNLFNFHTGQLVPMHHDSSHGVSQLVLQELGMLSRLNRLTEAKDPIDLSSPINHQSDVNITPNNTSSNNRSDSDIIIDNTITDNTTTTGTTSSTTNTPPTPTPVIRINSSSRPAPGQDYVLTNGDDTIEGGAGDDTITGDFADLVATDTVHGGGGTDSLIFSSGTVILNPSDLTELTGIESFTLVADAAHQITLTDAYFDSDGFGIDIMSVAYEGATQGIVIDASTLSAPHGVMVSTHDANDTITSGAGDDIIEAGNGDNTITSGIGNDSVISSSGQDTIVAGEGNDTVFSGDGMDDISGGIGDDLLSAEAGDDDISGDSGNDTIYGGSGLDTISGGEEQDVLIGGEGADQYVFSAINHSTAASMDIINDFSAADGDKIDLTGLGFEYIGNKAFSNTAHELRWSVQGSDVVIEADDDGDGIADFGLRLASSTILNYNDFIGVGLPAGSSFTSNTLDNVVGSEFDDFFAATNASFHATDLANGGIGTDTILFSDATNIALSAWANKTAIEIIQLSDDGNAITISDAFVDGSDTDSIIIEHDAYTITSLNASDVDASRDVVLQGTGKVTLSNHSQRVVLADGTVGDVKGGTQKDTVMGGDQSDTILGHNGDDVIYGGEGNDFLNGELHRDEIHGGAGDDTIYGGPDNTNNDRQDTIYGDEGNDLIYAGRYHDSLYGGEGNDTIYGQYHNDTLYGGAGNDLLDGGFNNDVLYAGTGQNTLVGGNNEDRIYGEDGTLNFITAGHGRDTIYGGTGVDLIAITDKAHSAHTSRDTIHQFTQGQDRVDVSELGFTSLADFTIGQVGAVTRVDDNNSTFRLEFQGTYTLTAADFVFAPIASDSDIQDQIIFSSALYTQTLDATHFSSIDDGNLIYSVTLSSGVTLPSWMSWNADTLTLSGTPAISNIGAYNVVIRAINGSGDIAEDSYSLIVTETDIVGTPDADTLIGTASNEGIVGLAGDDSILAGAGSDVIYGYEGNDTLFGQDGRDTIEGAEGDDVINGGNERDTLYGGEGDDTIIGGSTSSADREDYIYGGKGNDYIDGGYHHDRLYGDDGNDTIFGNLNNDYLYGGGGDDLLLGGNNEDRLYGQGGDDTLDGGAYRDYLYGSVGKDTFIFSSKAHSTIVSNLYDRIYTFTNGEDIIDLSALDFTDISDFTITYTGGWTRLDDNSSDFHFIIQGNQLTNLDNTDFIFSVPASDGDIDRQYLTINTPYNLALPAGMFTSIDDGNLSYTLSMTNGDPLPAWLSIDPSTGAISGTPPSSDAGLLDVKVRATNASDDSAEDDFEIMISDNFVIGTSGKDTLDGTTGNDALVGDADDDLLSGDDGNDLLYGEAGEDTLYGGNDKDTIYGGDDDDVIDGGYEADLIYSGAGDDIIYGGTNTNNNDRSDTIYGGDGDDRIHGGRYHDRIYGQGGNDRIDGGIHNEYIYGGDGTDLLHGGNNEDRLYGQDGNDTLIGGHGRDSLWGGAGDDVMIIMQRSNSTGGTRDLIYDFTQGEDIIDLSRLGLSGIGDLTFTQAGSWIRITEAGTTFRVDVLGTFTMTANDFIFSVGTADVAIDDMIVEAESAFSYNLPGGMFASIDDGSLTYTAWQTNGNGLPIWIDIDPTTGTLSGEARFDDAVLSELTIRATNGSGDIAEADFSMAVVRDKTTGTGADETLTGGAHANGLEGEGGNDSLEGLAGNDALFGGAGEDTILGGNNDDFIKGGDGNDSIDGGWHRDLIYGGAGDDTIYGGPDNTNNDRQDTIYGEDGDDYIHGGRYHDELYGGSGEDTIIGGIHNDTLYGGDDADSLDGSAQHDVLYGGNDNDTLYGGSNNDKLYGDSGNDTLDGGAHKDTLTGGAGDDVFRFSSLTHSAGSNIDRITDFTQGDDIIDLSGLGFTAISDLTITDDGSITSVSDGGSFVFELTGVHTLANSDFVF